eukprot:1482918-Prymnesium_polylepis.2
MKLKWAHQHRMLRQSQLVFLSVHRLARQRCPHHACDSRVVRRFDARAARPVQPAAAPALSATRTEENDSYI